MIDPRDAASYIVDVVNLSSCIYFFNLDILIVIRLRGIIKMKFRIIVQFDCNPIGDGDSFCNMQKFKIVYFDMTS